MPAATAAAIVFWAASVGSRMQPSPIRSSPAAGQSPVPVPPAMPHRASGDHHHTHQGYNRAHVGESPPRRPGHARRRDPCRDRGRRVRGGVSAIAPERQRLRLDLEGMTCASCAAAHRAEAEPARRRRRDRQLRDRGGRPSPSTPRRSRSTIWSRRSRRSGTAPCLTSDAPSAAATDTVASTARRRRGADRAARRCSRWSRRSGSTAGSGSRSPPRHPVVLWCGAAVPPRCAPERAPPRGDDGHARLARHARRLGVVDGRPARRARRAHLLRGRRP